MKRFFVSFALMALVIILSIASEIYLGKLEEKLFEQLKSAETSYRQGDDSVTDELQDVYKTWENNTAYLSIFINHDTLDQISESFLRLVASANAVESDFNSSLYRLKYELYDMLETERLNWKSFI